MLQITINGDRNEGKTLLAKLIGKCLDDLDIGYTLRSNLKPQEFITINSSKQMVDKILNE